MTPILIVWLQSMANSLDKITLSHVTEYTDLWLVLGGEGRFSPHHLTHHLIKIAKHGVGYLCN